MAYPLFQKMGVVLPVLWWLCPALTKMMKLWFKLPFSFLSCFRFSPVCCFLSHPPLGITRTAYRWAAAANGRRWPRWSKAALPREESGRGVALQTETQTVGQLPGEEGWGALQHERLTVGEWAWSGWPERKCGLWEACVSVCIVQFTVPICQAFNYR